MKTRWTIALLVLFAAAVSLSVLMPQRAWAYDDDDDDEEMEEAVEASGIPAAVQAAIERECVGGKIEEIEKEKEHGRVCYEADVIMKGLKYEVSVLEDGTLLSKELEEEDEALEKDIPLEKLPPAVRATLRREAPKAKALEAEMELATYEIDVAVGDLRYEIEIAENGLLVSKELKRRREGKEYRKGEKEEEHEGEEEEEEEEEEDDD